ncbi:UbiA family prenyltransferase [Methanoculleus frigidifontis]|uniref:UbiA family prenyltransferase n=1 Tax=Methanoculleus frigidifontis TaxID=2584085 RepID=UPI00265B1084|nr:UbiA family prenyltransferase [Methanoculleus sp. FWC-SCC1]
MNRRLAAFIDLTRAHFAVIWPFLFCSGMLLAFQNYGGFSWSLLVLNDYVDRDIDRRDVGGRLTRYWRPFHERPLPEGRIAPLTALALFLLLAALAAVLIAALPFPAASTPSPSWPTPTRRSTSTR